MSKTQFANISNQIENEKQMQRKQIQPEDMCYIYVHIVHCVWAGNLICVREKSHKRLGIRATRRSGGRHTMCQDVVSA